MESAFQELSLCDITGIQLTPGNVPTVGFKEVVSSSSLPTLTHHGFDWLSMRGTVWNEDAQCVTKSHSIHPPKKQFVRSNSGWRYCAWTICLYWK
ncbi:hypothetical protein [Pleionea sp. CnH1-48]|uniref:hypothetical protein n=1 Tax=Pleionea sp. CnH1-48 TaxID=2954494 RepID=UPI00209846EE|nr:hypothetical protein [Pleionea sp. CnH1-48]MCO7223025.1 hypothetical protein [Pleionea sp. CnH1-48]